MHSQYGGFFSVKIRGTLYRILYQKIILFEARGKKIVARTASQEYEFYDSIEEISRSLPDFFVRVHRGICINFQMVEAVSLSDKHITMTDGAVIPFSRTYRADIVRRVNRQESSIVERVNKQESSKEV